MNIQEQIAKIRLVPVVVLEDAKDAVPLAKALIAGGLPVAEVTFRTDAAEESIRLMSEQCPEMLVGAGTVITVAQAEAAVAAGAKFIVTAGFSEDVTRWAVSHDVPIFPGVCTPTEIMMALRYDLKIVKFFPAAQYGGLKTIKALAGPFPKLKFMPTGGVSAANVQEYLADPHIIACGGSWMVKGDLVKSGNFEEITRLTAEAMALVKAV